MKKFTFLVLMITGFVAMATAQISNPVKWSYTAVRLADKSYELHITAILENKWHIYAQEAGEGPEPTSFSFTSNPLLKFDGAVKEVGNLEKSFDPNFNSTLKFYSNKVDFVQKVKTKSKVSTVVKGTVSYMVCNDRKCLPPKEIPFTVKIPAK